jgi:hypothetical protein
VSNINGRCSGFRSTVYTKIGGGGAEIFQKFRSQQDDIKQAEYWEYTYSKSGITVR